jgi:hypothetical protein
VQLLTKMLVDVTLTGLVCLVNTVVINIMLRPCG